MVEEQIYGLKKERQRRLEHAESPSVEKVVQLMTLRGIAVNSSWKFVNEFFATWIVHGNPLLDQKPFDTVAMDGPFFL